MRRRRLGRRESGKYFSKAANLMHRRNETGGSNRTLRGGIRL